MNELTKITDLTGRYDVSARTLRYYENMGLISSIRSDDYAYRLYDEAAVKRLEQILILRRLNVSIRDIRRVFDAPGSDVVLEVLDKKMGDIDDEIALLHELKEVILEFIRQIKDADFSNDGDVKLLYEKAKDIESQLANVDYNGNPGSVNRLLEVTEKLAQKGDIVKKTRFYLMFHIPDGDSVGAFALYHKAFNAIQTSYDTLPLGDVYIGMEVNDFFILLRPGDESTGIGGSCCVNFATENELHRAYDVLTQEGQGSIHTEYHWTPLAAHVTDKYKVGWFFCV